MVRRGTRVGEAYIAVHADNKDWVRGVARQRQALRKQWEENGEEAGQWFSRAWDKSVSDRISRTWRDVIDAGAHQDFSVMERRWGSVTEAVERTKSAINDMYRADRENNVITKDQHDQLLENLYVWREVRTEQLASSKAAKESQERWAAANRAQKARLTEQIKAMANQEKLAGRILKDHEAALKVDRRRTRVRENIVAKMREQLDVSRELNASENEYVNKILRDHIDGVETYTAVFARMNEQNRRIARERSAWHVLEEEFRKYYNVVGELTERQREQIRALGAEMERTGNTVQRYFRNLRSQDRIAADQGVLFGRLAGSRNNLLNIVGRAAAPFERAMFNVFRRVGRSLGRLRPFQAISGQFQSLIARMQSGGRVARTFAAGLARITTNLPALVAAAGAAVAALVPVSGLLGALATLISAVGGMLTALAGSIAYAIGGVLAAAVPVLLGAAGGITALVVGIQGMSDAQKAALGPLEEWYDGLKTMVAENLFGNLGDQVSGLLEAVGPHLETVLSRSATAISGVIDGMIDKLNTPAFQGVMDTLDETVPGIVRAIGDSLSNLALGLLAVGSAISPQVESLLGDLADTLSEWSTWAASEHGQKSIAMWFKDAWASASDLWDVLSGVWDVLQELFAGGKGTGDNWLQGWADALGEFSTWLQSPEGQKALDDWYQKAQDIATEIGNLVDAFGELFDTLDSDEGENVLTFIIRAATGAVEATNKVLDVLLKVANWSIQSYSNIATWITINVVKPLERAYEWVMKRIPKWKQIGGDLIQGLLDGITEGVIYDTFIAPFVNIINWVKSLFGVASPSTVMFQIGVDIVQGLINGLRSMFEPLGVAAQAVVNTINRIWQNGEGGFPGVVGRALNEISGLIPGLTPIMEQAGTTAKNGIATMGTKMETEAGKIPGKVSVAMGTLDSEVKKEVDAAVASASESMGTLPGILEGIGSDAVGGLSEGLSGMASAASGPASDAVGAVSGLSDNAYSAGYSVGTNIGAGVIDGVSVYYQKVYDAAYSLGKTAVNAANDALISRSPSVAMRRVGENAVEGFLIPFTDQLDQVADASTKMAEAALSGLSPESMFARGVAASRGLTAGLGTSLSVGAEVSAMLGGSPNAGRSVNVASGAIQINSNARTPYIAAEQMLNGIAGRLVGE